MAKLWATCHACSFVFGVDVKVGSAGFGLKNCTARCPKCGGVAPLADGDYVQVSDELRPRVPKVQNPTRLRRPAESGHPKLEISRNDRCPCGSGRKVKKCLLADGVRRIHPGHAVTVPPQPPTGFTHPKCYLQASADCSEKISREHVKSRTILEGIGGNAIVASGHASQEEGEVGVFGIGSLVAKILCTRHNNALATLDGRARALAEGLANIGSHASSFGPPAPHHVMLNGHDIERWCLKNLLGMIAARNVRFNGVRVRDYQVPTAWTRVLMGKEVLRPPLGLYLRADLRDDEGVITRPIADYGVRPLWDQVGTIVGVEIRLLSHEFVLWLDEERRVTRPDLGALNYRCPMLYSKRDAESAVLDFSWEGFSSNIPVEITQRAIPSDGGCIPGHSFNTRWKHWGESLDETVERYERLHNENDAEDGPEPA